MIFLDIEVPRYTTSDIQENKTPELKKTIRGKGVLEKGNDYGFENDIILKFDVNENILKKMLKIYARFKTMILIPVFDSNLKSKIFDVYSEYIKSTLEAFTSNMNSKNLSDVIIEKRNVTSEILNETVFDDIKIQEKFSVNPKVKDCVMCFLKSFSYKSLEETSNGFEVELVLYPCEDLSFYIGNEGTFLKSFYKKFYENKLEIFKTIDQKIDNIFLNKEYNQDINITMENIYNSQTTYSKDKTITLETVPENIKIENKYISGIEIRSINNLKRVPIVGKAKGFIQNLGQGEIGITLRLVYNQKNIEEQKTIIKLRNLAHFSQENIVSSAVNFYLTDCIGIKEISISNVIISEPTSEVDVTIINLFMIGSLTNKLEEESNYYMEIERGSSNICSKIFSNFLDVGLQLTDINKLKDFSNINIFKSNIEKVTNVIEDTTTSNETGAVSGKEYYENDFSYTLKKLFDSYYFIDFNNAQTDMINYKTNDFEKLFNNEYKSLFGDYSNLGNGFSNFIKNIFVNNGVLRDSVAYEEILNRLYKYAFLFLNNYNSTNNEIFINNLIKAEQSTEIEFFEKIYSFYLAESFSLDMFKGSVGISNIVISNMFKIEIMNNYILIFKNMLDSNSNNINVLKNNYQFNEINNNGKLASPNKMDFVINGKFNNIIKETIRQCILSVYNTAESFVNTSTFVEKSLDFYKLNYASDTTGINFSKIRESLEEERDILLDKIREVKDGINKDDDVYFNNILIIFKSIILGNRLKLNSISNKMTLFDEGVILAISVLSLYLPNFNFEKNLIGKLSYYSAKNIIAPLAIATSSMEISKTFASKTEDDNASLNFINRLENFIESYFGKGTITELNKLSTTYITPNHTNKDYQSFLDIYVFEDFDSPLELFQEALNDSGLLIETEDYIKSVEKTIKTALETYDINKIYKDINSVQSTEDISEEINSFNSMFEKTNYIFDETINKQHIGTTIPATIATTELINYYKTFRTIKDIFSLVISQYKSIIPDYEVYIIDEQLINDAYEMGYDIDNKMYSIRNIISININKNDKTNIKTAIIKIANTRPYFIDMEYSFQERNLFESIDNENLSIYSTRFKTDKLVFRSGLIINVSLDSKNNFFDFTGKIDSVEINSSEIILTCSNFASELMSQKFNIKHVIRSGVKSVFSIFTALKEFITGYKNIIAETGNSKSYYLNQNIIPYDYISGKIDNKNLNYNLASFMPTVLAGIYKAGDTIRHLNSPYNDLMQGMNLSKAIEESESFVSRKWKDIFKQESGEITSGRIMENINAVEYDASFYGFIEADKINSDITGKEFILMSSSFIDRYHMFKDENYDPAILEVINIGNKFSYEREGISLYDLLNDMTLRNPAAFWDVIESGNFATLFFGRNNYSFTRKNKNNTLSKIDLLNILNVLLKLLYNLTITTNINKNDLTFEKELNISYETFKEIFLVLRNIAIISDNNLGMDNDTELKIRNIINSLKDLSKVLIYTVDNLSEEYNGEYTITNKLLAVSGYNLISCNIKTNENFKNTISLSYRGDFEDKIDRWIRLESSDIFTLKLFKGIPEFRETTKNIDPALTMDINTREQAAEYAQSVMYNDLREYYSGKIVTLYQPDIRRNSELVIIDSTNKIYGTVIVRDFQHMLSTDSGMITIITPGMKIGTTSLLSDIYMIDFLGWFKHEYKTLKGEYQFKPNEVKAKMDKILKDFFVYSTSVPVTFENVEYEVKYNKDNDIEKREGENIESSEIKVHSYLDAKISNSIKAEIDLPYKVYPLVKNNKMLIPDSDIYGRTEDSYYSIRNVLSGMISSLKNIIYGSAISDNYSYIKQMLNSYLFPGRNGYLEDIMKSYFPAMKSADFETKQEFEKRIFWDDYSDLLYSDNNYGIKIVKEFLERHNILFFNTKQLCAEDNSLYDENGNVITIGKIEKIAKIIFHFRIVNLVEISRYLNGEISDEVLNLLLEELNKLSSTINGVKYKNWKLITRNSLQNYDIYDDTVALLINLDSNPIYNIQYFNVNASVTDLQGKTLNKSIGVLKYTLKISDLSFANKNFDIDIYVFHNYYGGDFEDKALIVKTRILLLKDLLNKAYSKSTNERFMILGDFNLNLNDVINSTNNIETSNNELIMLNHFYKVLLKNTITTQGGEQYDNIIIPLKLYNTINQYFDFSTFKYNSSPYYDKNVSDHYPIYLNKKDNKEIFK